MTLEAGRLFYVPFKTGVDLPSQVRNWDALEDFLNTLQLRETGPIGGSEPSSGGGAPSPGDGNDGDTHYEADQIEVNLDGTWTVVFVRYTDGEAVTAMGALNDGNTLNHDRYTDADAADKIDSDDLYVPRAEYRSEQMPLNGVWGFHTDTDATPAAGDIQFDNATAASVTNIYVHHIDEDTADRAILLDLLVDTNDLLIALVGDADRTIHFTVNGSPSTSSQVVTIPVTYVAHHGTVPWSLNDLVILGVR